MMYWTCECGKAEYWGSGMSPQVCEGCDECGTNYRKLPTEPHDLRPQFDVDTGEPSAPICRRCYKRIKKK
jgi:hypothetical protein